MFRFFLPFFLLSIAACGSQYKFKVPVVAHPNLNDPMFDDVNENNTKYKEEARRKRNVENIRKARSDSSENEEDDYTMTVSKMTLHSFRTLNNSLNPSQLEWARNKWNLSAEEKNWRVFNHDANWGAIYKKGMDQEVYQAFSYRRAVVNETLIRTLLGLDTKKKLEIDYFDDYQAVTSCDNPKLNTTSSRVFQFRGKNHYAMFSYVCPPKEIKNTNICQMSTMFDMTDFMQGNEVPWLSDFTLRTDVGANQIQVKTWRHFNTCELGNFVTKIYPELPMRLDWVGLTELDIHHNENRNILLALRLFGQEILHNFRLTIPGFPEGELADLEQVERFQMKTMYKDIIHDIFADQAIVGDAIGKKLKH